ncbi:hypothetical protein N665_0263s0022 [Sinapis alba]|nr:hypothetical protein N665_0263s0022 [Sinapis alba]
MINRLIINYIYILISPFIREELYEKKLSHKPVTVRPAETRMGSGKGSPEYWVAMVKPGKILYEMDGVPENIARKAISIAASKMPIKKTIPYF